MRAATTSQIVPIYVNEIKASKETATNFHVKATWCKCFRVMLPIFFFLKRVGRVNLVNVTETSLRKPLCLLPQKCLYKCSCIHDMTCVICAFL